ncbi:DUF397 domain-containing protein [Streptomyces sp. NPDC008137]|uniref:DUF397 domain-containing protein n=1 Tax=Streptomyces sp. NPDC008137 TaxID=3364813 RepID=UPI0036E2BC4B
MAILLGATEKWTTSSYTNGSGACVQVRSTAVEALDVGDTKVPDGPTLTFPADAWSAFVALVR